MEVLCRSIEDSMRGQRTEARPIEYKGLSQRHPIAAQRVMRPKPEFPHVMRINLLIVGHKEWT